MSYDGDKEENFIDRGQDRPATPVENVTMDLEREQGMLFEALTILAEKMRPVLKSPYSRDNAIAADEPSRDVDGHSPLVRQLSSCVARTRTTREIVDYLLKTLES